MSGTTKLFYIQNKGFVGNCLLWWREGGNGYTCNLDEAWKVTEDKAREICSTRPKEDIPHECSIVDALARRHVTAIHTAKSRIQQKREGQAQ